MNERPTHPFMDDQGNARTLLGCAIYTASPRAAELAARLGFDAVWIDMEHASCDLRQAEALCVAVECGGGIPLVRTAGTHRDHILHALEIGGRIIVIPMVEDADTARQLVEFGKYPPMGRRGYFRFSRGLEYGQDADWLAIANASTALLPQVETLAAVEQLEAILAVPGIDGVLLGPGDLSAELGIPGQFDHPRLESLLKDCLKRIARSGKLAGIVAGSPGMMRYAHAGGARLIVSAGDLPTLAQQWAHQLHEWRAMNASADQR